MADELPAKDDFSEWYNELLFQAEIMDVRYPAKGVYVWFPFGYDLRKKVYDKMHQLLGDSGHREAGFPVLIPEGILAKEGEHIAGFEDEVFWVTHGGEKELDERLALRPTSETPMYTMFDLWIRSHGDLPLKIYQVVNIWRSETEHTRPLIRLREITGFKEAHTAHASYSEAEQQVETALDIYRDFYDYLGIPIIITERPEWDKFPGADYTYAIDTLMPDGKTLQIGTAHNLGQNFSEAFEVDFETKSGDHDYVYQTSYGISERCIAAIMGVHGDDNGLVLPSAVAPTQVVIIPILFGDTEEINEEIMDTCTQIKDDLSNEGLRVELDDSDDSPGAKFYKWELKGAPLRIEIGPRDLDEDKATLVNRLGEESEAGLDGLTDDVIDQLVEVTDSIRRTAGEGFDESIIECESYDEANDVAGNGIAFIGWCGSKQCGLAIENEVGVDLLGEPRALNADIDECLECREPADKQVLLANTY